jgi:hypothetical protein
MSKRGKSTFRRLVAVVVLSLSLVAGFYVAAGCTAGQLAQGDKIVQDVNQVAQGTAGVAHGPAAELIPEAVRIPLDLIGYAGMAGALLWKRIRESKILERSASVTATARAIVQAVEALPADPPDGVPSVQLLMKRAVKTQMQAAAAATPALTYAKLNAVVDELKATP